MTDAQLTITRIFAAPRELVFRAWTEPAHFAQWFGSEAARVRLETVAMDVRPGGAWKATMLIGPDRVIHWKGVYLEVTPPARLVFTLSDQPGDEAEVVTVMLTERDGQTEMVFQQSGGHLTAEQYAQAGQGWQAFFDRIDALLARAD
jgi:uncharacterized protein YndB with AHSA1/START domain